MAAAHVSATLLGPLQLLLYIYYNLPLRKLTKCGIAIGKMRNYKDLFKCFLLQVNANKTSFYIHYRVRVRVRPKSLVEAHTKGMEKS